MLALVLFATLLLAVCLYGLAASGHFPRRQRTVLYGTGSTILYGSIATAALSLLVGIACAWQMIPWYAAVIGGGSAVLTAPLVLQALPGPFVDGRSALIVFAGGGAMLALTMMWIAADGVSGP